MINVTSEALIQGMVKKAMRDFVFFCKHCFFIRDKMARVVPLVLNKSQMKIWSAVKEQMDAGQPVRIAVLKPRQIGVSTVVEALQLWEMLRRGIHAVTMAHKDDAAQKIYGVLRFAYDNLPPWLVTALGAQDLRNNSSGLELSHTRAQVNVFSAAGEEPGRSGTIQFAHLSEVAFYPDPEKVLSSLFSAVPEAPGTVIIEESTGNGPVGYFAERYERAKSGVDGYKAIFIPWYEHEEYRLPVPPGEKVVCPDSLRHLYDAGAVTDEQLYWRQVIIARKYVGKESLFVREYPATEEEAFLAETANFFSTTEVQKRLKEVASVPYEEGDVLPGKAFASRPGADLRVFKMPVPGRCYVIGADAASGVAGKGWANFSAADVLDVTTGEQVAHMHTLVESGEFARRLQLLGEFYNTALIAIETTDGHGLAAAAWLRDAGYPMLYQRRVYDRVGQQWVSRLGWSTNARTKPFMLDMLRSAFVTGRITINDERTLREMLTFVKDEKGKLGAVAGAMDDAVMSLAIAVMAWKDYGPYLSGFAPVDAHAEPPEEASPPPLNVRVRSRDGDPFLHPELGVYF